jgi:hypothetical protein
VNLEIKKLLLQVAPRSGEDGEYLPSLHTPEDIERFAQLIVQECGNIAFEHWALTHNTSPQEAILKHFGVEE